MRYTISVCSRENKRPKSLATIHNYSIPGVLQVRTSWDNPSIYYGHQLNALKLENDDDIFVMAHDDIEILSNHGSFYRLLEICNKPGVGFIGVAGASRYDNMGMQGAWWNARHTGEARGFVFQGGSNETMTPNWFGHYGQVVVLDGCFLACSYKTLKAVGLDKPHYLTSDWDFYDIHLTLKAHLLGLNNFAVPIIIRHESAGEMRPGWFEAKNQFAKYHNGNLPVKLNPQKTVGIPK